ncbi:hypothetical protein EVU97_14610 [Dermacoccus sp. 147Ba]|uniref:hypothetical protein n=1 Tax=Dermacoccus sp. 147Ba TaxID=2510111 RepID=UPI00101D28F9|nr:hypothetical protein [Dermacoccus sp. 147Ba]RYI20461.1 hypothetical protein EVU97_14610 [Dermacoccus sp. 147Ba]
MSDDGTLFTQPDSPTVRRAREVKAAFDRLQEEYTALQVERAELVHRLGDEGWTSYAVADLFGMSRVNVFKIKERYPREQ